MNWIVSVSDGQRISSNSFDSNVNPWDKVLEYLRKNLDINQEKKYITHVELIVNNVRYNSPTLSKNSLFLSSEDFGKFWIFYKHVSDLAGGNRKDNYTGLSYRLGDYRHFLWVNEKNNFSYSQILNVVNPHSKIEKQFSDIENSVIKKMYEE